MTWTMDCRECSGSGKGKKAIHRMFKPPSNNCPTCSGKGGWWLGVVCDHTKPSSDKPNAPWIACSPDGSKEKCLECHGKGYTVMTVKEEHEIHLKWIADTKEKYPKAPIKAYYHERFIHHVRRGNVTYKGSPVRLIGRDK